MIYKMTMVDGETFLVTSELNQQDLAVAIAKLSDDSFLEVPPNIMIRAKYISHIKIFEDGKE